MKAYFPKIDENDENDKNVTVAFRYAPDKNHENLELRISASNAFGVFSDGKLIFRGPIRSAHGYSHVSNVEFRSVMPTCIVIEVAYYGINGFAYVDEPPFLAAELVANGEIVAPPPISKRSALPTACRKRRATVFSGRSPKVTLCKTAAKRSTAAYPSATRD